MISREREQSHAVDLSSVRSARLLLGLELHLHEMGGGANYSGANHAATGLLRLLAAGLRRVAKGSDPSGSGAAPAAFLRYGGAGNGLLIFCDHGRHGAPSLGHCRRSWGLDLSVHNNCHPAVPSHGKAERIDVGRRSCRLCGHRADRQTMGRIR